MPIERPSAIHRFHLQAARQKLFVYGGTMEGTHVAGQAYIMQGEPNAVKLPVKKRPGLGNMDYFTDSDLGMLIIENTPAYGRLTAQINFGGIVVWPYSGLMGGELEARAPAIHRYYREMLEYLYKRSGIYREIQRLAEPLSPGGKAVVEVMSRTPDPAGPPVELVPVESAPIVADDPTVDFGLLISIGEEIPSGAQA